MAEKTAKTIKNTENIEEHMTDTRSKNMEDKSKAELIKIIEEQSALLRREQRKRAKLGLTFETPNNRLQKQLEEIQRGERESLGNWDEDISEVVRNNIPYLVKREDKTFVTDEEAGTHTLIKGDNFPALLTLYPEYRGKVDVIYIDPPYNTGNKDFIYNDRYVNTEDGYRHSMWLSFMARRLLLAQELLSETGVIFVSIDDNEQAYLKVLMDEIFGAGNFLNQINWLNNLKGRQISVSGASKTTEYILAYAKNSSNAPHFQIDAQEASKLMPSAYGKVTYPVKEDEFGEYVTKNELHNTNSKFNEVTRPNLVYPIFYNPKTGEVKPGNFGDSVPSEMITILPKRNNNGANLYHAWRWGKEKVLRESQDLYFECVRGDWKVYTKIRDYRVTNFKDVITNIGSGNIDDIVGRNTFSYPKPTSLLKILVGASTFKNSIVLDFFAGSGTTGHAVAELNAEDGGNRRCILVTDAGKSGNSENSNMSGNNENAVDIAEDVTYERMRRVLTGEDWANPAKAVALNQNLEMFEVSFLPKAEQGMRKTAFELKMDLEDVFVDLGIDEDLAEIYAERLYNRWEKFAENDKGDLEQWD